MLFTQVLLEDCYLKSSWSSAHALSGKDVGTNNNFMVLFEQNQLKMYKRAVPVAQTQRCPAH